MVISRKYIIVDMKMKKERNLLTKFSKYMMNMKKIEELTGFRNPNDQEKDRISRYFQNVFQKNIKTCQTASAVLCVVGVLCMTSYDGIHPGGSGETKQGKSRTGSKTGGVGYRYEK